MQQFVSKYVALRYGVLYSPLVMQNLTPNAVQLLRDEFAQRQRKNPAYSLRAFAQQIGLNPGTISSLFNGKRKLTPKTARKILKKMPMSPVKREVFQSSVRNDYLGVLDPSLSVSPAKILVEENHYRIISEWEHYAVLTLMDVRDFKSDPKWIADRLGLSLLRTEQVLHRLLSEGFIKKDSKGHLKRSFERLATTEDVASQALREAHEDELKIASKKLSSIPIQERDFSSLMVATSKRKLSEAKNRIRLFRKEMIALLEDPHADEVYQIQIQFFPLTESKQSTQNNITKNTKKNSNKNNRGISK